MDFDFSNINNGEKFNENSLVNADDLNAIVDAVYEQRNVAVSTQNSYTSFVSASKGVLPDVHKWASGYPTINISPSSNSEHYMSVVENLTLKFPILQGYASDMGKTIFVQFISGEIATKLTIENATLQNFVPLANHICEIQAIYVPFSDNSYGWDLVARQYPAVVE